MDSAAPHAYKAHAHHSNSYHTFVIAHVCLVISTCARRWSAALFAADHHLEAVERDYIVTVLRHTNWVITGPRGAATVLGLNPSTLRSRIKKLGISRSPG